MLSRKRLLSQVVWMAAFISVGASAQEGTPTRGTGSSGFRTPPPDGAVVVLPRDAIPAVYEPRFVEGARAGLPASAEVIGVALGGEARAYSINLLDGHEIANDTVGGKKIAVTW